MKALFSKFSIAQFAL